MGRDTGPKDRQSRRIGEKLFLKGQRDLSPKSATIKKNYPPGLHGPKQFMRKVSDYGKQLTAKQKIKKMYRLREHQFLSYYKKASRLKGNPSENLLKFLENRFDNVIYRLNLADSRDQARQLVTHGHFLINGKKVNIPSYQVEEGDKITIREKSITNGIFSVMLKEIVKKDVPEWLSFDTQNNVGTIVGKPSIKELNLGKDATLTVEFYSR